MSDHDAGEHYEGTDDGSWEGGSDADPYNWISPDEKRYWRERKEAHSRAYRCVQGIFDLLVVKPWLDVDFDATTASAAGELGKMHTISLKRAI
jgi:hypothetical protein